MMSSANTSNDEGDPNWATVNYGNLEALGNLHPSTSATQNVLGSSGIPGLAPTGRAGLQSDLRSSFYDQQHQEFYEFYGGMQHLNSYVVERAPGSQNVYTHYPTRTDLVNYYYRTPTGSGYYYYDPPPTGWGYCYPPPPPPPTAFLYPYYPTPTDLVQPVSTKTPHATTVVTQDKALSYTERATVATKDKAQSHTEQASEGDFIPFVEGTYI